MIYLFTSDGHRDSVDLSHYATTEQELIQLVQKHYEEIYWDVQILKHEVDFLKNQIITTYLEYGETEIHTTYFFTLDKI